MIPRRFLSLILFLGLILQGKAACADFDVSSVKGPHIKDLYMVIYRDPDSQMLALQKGELDVLGDIARPSDVDRLASNQEISLSISRGFHLFFMGFNLRKEPWNDRTLRHAAAMAVPSRQIVRDIFSGYSEPVDTYLPPVSPYYEPDVTVHEHDPAKARQILADAGWKWSTEGTLIPVSYTHLDVYKRQVRISGATD